jgi:hypothetical protein
MGNSTLLQVASQFFKGRGYVVECDRLLVGFSGLLHRFDLLVSKEEEQHAVLVLDWNKTVGIDTIIKADQAAADVALPSLMLVARKFSDHVRAYANKKRITLVTENELVANPIN